jgi:hypothetical protein
MPCYVLRCGETEMVKIGWADQDVEARVHDLQCAHYETLVLIRVIDGGPWIERAMHREFAEFRVRREWFRFHPEMLIFEPLALDEKPTTGLMSPIRNQRGLLSKIAKALGMSRAAISLWDKVPAERLPEVEAITGIHRHILRPDICHVPQSPRIFENSAGAA